MPAVGDLIADKYRILRLLGDGGMGSVYAARHEGLGTEVALKFLHPELAERPAILERFTREARACATIDSPYVVKVTDVANAGGVPYLVMDLLAGRSLSQHLYERGKLSTAESLRITEQILLGLEAAHERGIVHRDLKPDNVILTEGAEGLRARLIDFGIAKVPEEGGADALTRAGAMMGTPEYMAPEQFFDAGAADARADLFSVGAMLYEMLSGVCAVEGAEPSVIVSTIMGGRITPLKQHLPEIVPALARVVHQALDPSPEQRPQSARQMRLQLEDLARGDAPVASVVVERVPDNNTTVEDPVLSAGMEPLTRVSNQGNAERRVEEGPGDTEDAPPWVPPANEADPSVLRTEHVTKGARRFWISLLIVLAVLLAVAIAVIIILDPLQRRRPEARPGLEAFDAGLPVVIEPLGTAAGRDAAPPRPITPVPTPTSTRGPQPGLPREPDAGTAPAPSAIPPFTFPSSLPSLPSSLPPLPGLPSGLPIALPSSLPTIPGLPLPRSTPAPAPTSTQK